jgi:hypothetical protein
VRADAISAKQTLLGMVSAFARNRNLNSVDSAEQFSICPYFFVSHKLALCRKKLPESRVILSYHQITPPVSILPFQDVAITLSSRIQQMNNWMVVKYAINCLQLFGCAPMYLQKLFIRILQPLIFGIIGIIFTFVGQSFFSAYLMPIILVILIPAVVLWMKDKIQSCISPVKPTLGDQPSQSDKIEIEANRKTGGHS